MKWFDVFAGAMRPLVKACERAGQALERHVSGPRNATIERMEARSLLSGAIAVSQFKSLDYTRMWDEPQVALDANGDFVVVWGNEVSSTNEQVVGQLFNSSGSPVGTSIAISNNATGYADAPAVAMDSAGDFDVTWNNGGERYNSVATPLGTLPGSPYEYTPAPIGSDSQGNIGIISGSTLQLYTSAGVANGAPITLSEPNNDMSMNASGNFVATTWAYDGANHPGVEVQAFAANGTPTTGTILASQPSSGDDARFSYISMNGSGQFAVVWDSFDSTHPGLYAQAYTASGSPVGSNILISATSGTEGRDIVMLPNGGFDVAYTTSAGVDLQAFSSLAAPLGSPQLLVADPSAEAVFLSANANGNIVAVWADYPSVSGGTGEIYAEQLPEPASSILMLGSAYFILSRRDQIKRRADAGHVEERRGGELPTQ
jgi:hypothetical protein